MSVTGTGCLWNKDATVGVAMREASKLPRNNVRYAGSNPQMVGGPVFGWGLATITVLAVGAVVLGIAGNALAQCGSADIPSPVHELKAWLAASAKAGETCKSLPVEQLRGELDKGNQADWGTVAGILVECSRSECRDGIELARVRRALETWLGELPPPDFGDLAAACRSAKGAFRPNDKDDLARVRSELALAVERLDARLKAAGETGEGWRAYLKWDTLQEQLTGPSDPDLAVLNSLYAAYDGGYEGLRLIWFDDVRLALRQYLYTARAIGNSKLAGQYDSLLEELAKRVEAYGVSSSAADALVIGQAIQWLHDAGQAGWLVSAIRLKSLRPNMLTQVSARFIRAAMSRDIDETEPVRDCILGTDVHATAHTVGRLDVELGVAEDHALIHVLMSGTAESDGVGYNGPVRIYNSGTTRISARKTIVADAEHVRALPAVTDATTSTTIHDIQSNKGRQLVEKFAWKRASRQKCEAEWIAARHAEERVDRRVDRESDELVGRAEEAYQTKFRTPLGERKLLPEDMRISSTEAYVSVVSVQAGPFDLAAASEPPALGGEPDLAVRVHESMVRNLASGALSGMLLEEERVLSTVTDLLGSLPEELVPDEESEPWGVTFSRRTPIEVSFSEGQFKVTVRGRKFARGETEYTGMNISAVYKIEKTDAGFRAVRQGELEIVPPGSTPDSGKRLSANEQVLRTMLQRRLDKMFDEVLVPEPIVLSGELSDRGALVLTEWKAEDGWLVMCWQWKPAE